MRVSIASKDTHVPRTHLEAGARKTDGFRHAVEGEAGGGFQQGDVVFHRSAVVVLVDDDVGHVVHLLLEVPAVHVVDARKQVHLVLAQAVRRLAKQKAKWKGGKSHLTRIVLITVVPL